MIETRGLARRFGERTVVNDVSFDVPAGMLTGFVGANGAGKTTTMRMIMGLLGLYGGEVLWQQRPITAADRRRFGYMPEERGLYPKQKILDQLVYLGRLPVCQPRRRVNRPRRAWSGSASPTAAATVSRSSVSATSSASRSSLHCSINRRP